MNKLKKFDSPFFIIGSVRSGTTLLRLMLGHHPMICSCYEMEYVTPAIKESNKLPIDVDIDEYIDFLKYDRTFPDSGFEISDKDDFVSIVQDFFRQLCEREQKDLYGATIHNHFDKIPHIWPNAKYIHILRDPRDVVRSCVNMGWGGNPWCASQIWVNAYHNYLNLTGNVTPENIINVKFESLIDNPKKELTKICSFLGINYEAEMLNIAKDTTYSNIGKNIASTWRNSATDYEISQIETAVGDLLAKSDYVHSGLPPIQKSLWNITKLKAMGHMNRNLFKVRRYGFYITFVDYFSRKLSIKKLHNVNKLKMNEIEKKYLS